MKTYYSIFDIESPLLESNKEIQAESPSKAIKSYLNSRGEQFTDIKIDGSNYARLKAEPFYIKDGIKYRDRRKKSMWFSVIK